ncbi:MAG: cytochrome c biogenesis protein DipZ [Actinomycetia bacterium]|nr:cytochrome c biogenesis protein DipZ [Actinomycetes bacterium]
MATLIGIAFVAGLVTAISPCVLPVLPIIFASSASGSARRPFVVVAGLVVSFTAFTLAATALLSALGLPGDLLRNIAIAVVLVMAIALVFPFVARYVGKPFEAFGRFRFGTGGGGFVLGLSLGLLFAPCAGPIIAAVSLIAATKQFSLEAVAVTLVYALGAGIVLLAIAIAAQRGLSAPRLRARAPQIRQALGVLMVGAAVVLILGLDGRLAANVPDYVQSLQGLEESTAAATAIRELTGSEGSVVEGADQEEAVAAVRQAAAETGAAESAPAEPEAAGGAAGDSASGKRPEDQPPAGGEPAGPEPETTQPESPELALLASLPDYGPAPEFTGLEGWINSGPFTLEGLRGNVVLIDFWTYSCVNCIRTLPHLKRWHDRYADEGLVIVGVHTPEFAFERERDNVEEAVEGFEIAYPVALDPDFGTWRAWGNRYWPAKYFIDRDGNVRFAHFGEGHYEESELVIRALLAAGPSQPSDSLLVSTGLSDLTPSRPQTHETYLGYRRAENHAGDPFQRNQAAAYTLPGTELPEHGWALAGTWTVEDERAVAGENAVLHMRFLAEAAHLVLGPSDETAGPGTVDVTLDGTHITQLTIDEYRLYTLAAGQTYSLHDLELEFSPGTAAYAFTFGEIQPGAG